MGRATIGYVAGGIGEDQKRWRETARPPQMEQTVLATLLPPKQSPFSANPYLGLLARTIRSDQTIWQFARSDATVTSARKRRDTGLRYWRT